MLLGYVSIALAQKFPAPTRVWSVGPLTKAEPATMGIVIGGKRTTVTGPQVDPQTGSRPAATRSVVFAGDRIVIASKVGMRNVEGAQIPETVYQLLSLDIRTGEVKDTRDTSAFASLGVFAACDEHIIMSGRSLMRLTPDLKDAGTFDGHARGNKSWLVRNISPGGSTLGNGTDSGFELIDARTLQARTLTDLSVSDASVSSKAAVSDSPFWFRDYPKAKSFATLTNERGRHLIFHGDCGGPQFLSDDRILISGCKTARIIDTQGNVLHTINLHDPVAFAGVSQNGRRFALQLAGKCERFVVYSVDTGEPAAEVMPDEPPQEQSWTAFSHDGTMLVVGSPLKLTLYRLP